MCCSSSLQVPDTHNSCGHTFCRTSAPVRCPGSAQTDSSHCCRWRHTSSPLECSHQHTWYTLLFLYLRRWHRPGDRAHTSVCGRCSTSLSHTSSGTCFLGDSFLVYTLCRCSSWCIFYSSQNSAGKCWNQGEGRSRQHSWPHRCWSPH